MFSYIRPYIFNIDPEAAHNLAIKSLKYNFLPESLFAVENEEILSVNLFGKSIKNPMKLVNLYLIRSQNYRIRIKLCSNLKIF